MSDSNRGDEPKSRIKTIPLLAVLAVAAVVGLLAYLGGRYVDEREDRAEYNYAHAQENAAQTCLIREGIASKTCIDKEVKAERDYQATKNDLKAQQEMAEWAFWMVIFTCATMAITGVGVWLVWRTLQTNKGFLKETRDATRAMVRQNDLTEQSQRPWVVVDHIQWHEDGVIRVYFKNIGKTPAMEFTKNADAIAMPKVFLASAIPELDGANATKLFPSQPEIMTVDCPQSPLSDDYEWYVRIFAKYRLPSGDGDTLVEAFAFDSRKNVRKVTARDFLPIEKRHGYQKQS